MDGQKRAIVPWSREQWDFFIRMRYGPRAAQAWSAAREFQESMDTIHTLASSQNDLQALSLAILNLAKEQEGNE